MKAKPLASEAERESFLPLEARILVSQKQKQKGQQMSKAQKLHLLDKEERRAERNKENIVKARLTGNFKLAETLEKLEIYIQSRKAKDERE